MAELHASSNTNRHNATAGVYGARAGLWMPAGLYLFIAGAYVWMHQAALLWHELAWLVSSFAQTAIRWPHVQNNRSNKVVTSRLTRPEQWLMLAVFLAFVCLPALAMTTRWFESLDYTLPTGSAWIGVGLMVASLWLFHRSHADLGRNWSPSLEVHAEHELVTQGVYGRIRHPMYASIWLFALAQPFLIQNWVGGALVLPVFACLYFVRVPQEEQLMRDTFGEAYDAYARRSGRLWPR